MTGTIVLAVLALCCALIALIILPKLALVLARTINNMHSSSASETADIDPFSTSQSGGNTRTPIASAVGVGATVELIQGKIRITRKRNARTIMMGLPSESEADLSSLAKVQIKKATLLSNGYLRLISGSEPVERRGMFEALRDIHTVFFKRDQQASFEKLHRLLVG